MRWRIGAGYTPIHTMHTTSGLKTNSSRTDRSGIFSLSGCNFPNRIFWRATRRYSAAKITPVVANAVAMGYSPNDPISTRNSPTNPFVPGKPMDDKATSVSIVAKAGTTRAIPPKAEISRVWRRSYIMPAMKKRAPVEMP